MKKAIVICIVFVSLFVSCKKEKETEVVTTPSKNAVVESSLIEECYQGILKKDTTSLTINFKDSVIVSGRLTYNNFEKDKNEGTITGIIKGDTLIVDYAFMSEGTSSIRQVAFLKKGNTLTEGFGEVKDNNGKVVFKDLKKLDFSGKLILSKTDCKM